jgi:hypothetical protein
MALFNECTQWCAHIVLDMADIVRDGDIATIDQSARFAGVRNSQPEINGRYMTAVFT